MQRHLDNNGILTTTPLSRQIVEIRGKSGRLYGLLNPQTLTIEVKRKGEPAERIDLRPYLEAAKR